MLALATLNWERPTVAEDGSLHWLLCNTVCQNHSKGHVKWEEDVHGSSQWEDLVHLRNNRIEWQFCTTSSLQTGRISNLPSKGGSTRPDGGAEGSCCWTHSSCKPPFVSILHLILYTHMPLVGCVWRAACPTECPHWQCLWSWGGLKWVTRLELMSIDFCMFG